MKPEPLPFDQLVEVNVDRSANSFPPGFVLLQAAARISLQVGNIEEVELDTFSSKAVLFPPQSPNKYWRGRISNNTPPPSDAGEFV
jgi:hypothetical protein